MREGTTWEEEAEERVASKLELDLNPLHRLGEVVPDEWRQLFCIFGHPPHRHSLGTIADGVEIGR